ncbi:hypothetical protein ABW21_db0202372 [Orbilia brochopaga]|nr:hypothetical protein ABW21_db0202372 [Drechslerella brochopaga]
MANSNQSTNSNQFTNPELVGRLYAATSGAEPAIDGASCATRASPVSGTPQPISTLTPNCDSLFCQECCPAFKTDEEQRKHNCEDGFPPGFRGGDPADTTWGTAVMKATMNMHMDIHRKVHQAVDECSNHTRNHRARRTDRVAQRRTHPKDEIVANPSTACLNPKRPPRLKRQKRGVPKNVSTALEHLKDEYEDMAADAPKLSRNIIVACSCRAKRLSVFMQDCEEVMEFLNKKYA